MDGHRFDELTRALTQGASRRRLLRGALATLGGALVGGLAAPALAACPSEQVYRQRIGCVCKATGRPPNDAGCPCPTGHLRCGDACLDTTRDLANCGGCGIACPASPDPCRVAVCRTGACTTLPAPAETRCDDGNACTRDDACDGAGRCVGVPTLCDDGLDCTQSACDPASGKCVHPIAAGFCLIAGVCVAAATRHPTSPCQLCDPAQATDAWSNAPLGIACDDTTLCNGQEACDGRGTCQPGIPVECLPLNQCHDAGVCDPATGHCTTPAKFNGTPCDDGDACTTDTCQDGVCVGRVTVECNPLRLCNRLLGCDPATGQCVYEPADEGEPCGQQTACSDRVCRAGACLLEPKPAGTPCDDGNACTRDETCDGAGACRPDLIVTCFSLNPCQQAGTCDPATGECHYTPAPAGTVCRPAVDDCSPAAVCDGETFACPANPSVCDDGLVCTANVCDPEFGCVRSLRPGFCLISEVCYPEGELHSNPAFPCFVCDPAQNGGEWTERADGTYCGGHDRCADAATCRVGSCLPAPVVCQQPAEFCQRADCDPATGACVVTAFTDTQFGDRKGCLRCPDCVTGECIGTPLPIDCGIGTCRTCDPATSTCVLAPSGTDCGSTCNTRLTCDAAGACREVPGGGCVNIGECPAKQCDPATLKCVETGDHDGQPCGGDPCRECRDGQCGLKVCGECQQCDPISGRCVACEPCCRGICGWERCGRDDLCCAPDYRCGTFQGGLACISRPRCLEFGSQRCGEGCCTVDQQCCGDRCCAGTCCSNGCCPSGEQCCSVVIGGEPACCPADTTCCPTQLGGIVCCPGACSITGFGC